MLILNGSTFFTKVLAQKKAVFSFKQDQFKLLQCNNTRPYDKYSLPLVLRELLYLFHNVLRYVKLALVDRQH
jgi:hypothetical protein